MTFAQTHFTLSIEENSMSLAKLHLSAEPCWFPFWFVGLSMKILRARGVSPSYRSNDIFFCKCHVYKAFDIKRRGPPGYPTQRVGSQRVKERHDFNAISMRYSLI
jgi:hypothetical protein